MQTWIDAALHWLTWGLIAYFGIAWTIVAAVVGYVFCLVVKRRDQQVPRDEIGYSEVEQVFATTPPAPDPTRLDGVA